MKAPNNIKSIILALIIGIVYVLPHILFMAEMKRDYRLVFLGTHDRDRYIYAGRVREVYDGHYLVTDSHIYENKAKPYFRTFLSELTMGLLGKIFNLPINWLFILGDFLLPIAIFYLVLYFLFIVTRSVNLSIFGAFFVVLGDFLDIIHLFITTHSIEGFFLTFSRTINPQFHFIFFIFSLIFAYKALKNAKFLDIVLAGLTLGLLFYTYPYFWSYLLMVYFLLIIRSLFQKDLVRTKAIFYIVIEALIISIPYWINYIHLSQLPYYPELATRFGLLDSRQPLILKLPTISIILFLLYKGRDFNFYFIFSSLLSVFLCINQHIITGIKLEPEEWYWCPGRQMAMISGIILIHNFFTYRQYILKRIFLKSDYKRYGKYLLAVLLILNIFIHGYTQVFGYESTKKREKDQQFLHEPFLWLNRHTKADEVVLASSEVSLLIPIFTHNNVYRTPLMFETLMPDAEVIERFFILARLFGMSRAEVIEYVLHRATPMNIKSEFFGDRLSDPRYKTGNESYALNKIEEKLTKRYRAIEKEDIYTLLKKFRLDYIFYGPYERGTSSVDLDRYRFLEKVYDEDDVRIYRVIGIR